MTMQFYDFCGMHIQIIINNKEKTYINRIILKFTYAMSYHTLRSSGDNFLLTLSIL